MHWHRSEQASQGHMHSPMRLTFAVSKVTPTTRCARLRQAVGTTSRSSQPSPEFLGNGALVERGGGQAPTTRLAQSPRPSRPWPTYLNSNCGPWGSARLRRGCSNACWRDRSNRKRSVLRLLARPALNRMTPQWHIGADPRPPAAGKPPAKLAAQPRHRAGAGRPAGPARGPLPQSPPPQAGRRPPPQSPQRRRPHGAGAAGDAADGRRAHDPWSQEGRAQRPLVLRVQAPRVAGPASAGLCRAWCGCVATAAQRRTPLPDCGAAPLCVGTCAVHIPCQVVGDVDSGALPEGNTSIPIAEARACRTHERGHASCLPTRRNQGNLRMSSPACRRARTMPRLTGSGACDMPGNDTGA